jgi:hypothetical protein
VKTTCTRKSLHFSSFDTKARQHDQNTKTKQEERRESNGGGIKEECDERSKGGRPGKKADKEAGIWLWDTEGGMDGAWNRGMAQNLGVWREGWTF